MQKRAQTIREELEGLNLMGHSEITVSKVMDHKNEHCSPWKDRKTRINSKQRLKETINTQKLKP